MVGTAGHETQRLPFGTKHCTGKSCLTFGKGKIQPASQEPVQRQRNISAYSCPQPLTQESEFTKRPLYLRDKLLMEQGARWNPEPVQIFQCRDIPPFLRTAIPQSSSLQWSRHTYYRIPTVFTKCYYGEGEFGDDASGIQGEDIDGTNCFSYKTETNETQASRKTAP